MQYLGPGGSNKNFLLPEIFNFVTTARGPHRVIYCCMYRKIANQQTCPDCRAARAARFSRLGYCTRRFNLAIYIWIVPTSNGKTSTNTLKKRAAEREQTAVFGVYFHPSKYLGNSNVGVNLPDVVLRCDHGRDWTKQP